MSDEGRTAGEPIRFTESGSFIIPVQDPAKILVIDPDPFFQEMLEAGFRIFNPGFSILKADNPETGLVLLRRHEIDAVITEFEFPESTQRGTELLHALDEFSPQLPVLVVTVSDVQGDHSDLARLRNVRAVVPKPPDMDALLRQINRMLQENRESVLRGISLESFLQVLEVERKTCTLIVTAGPHIGRIYIHAGELIHAETEFSQSKAAAFVMLSWQDVQIKIVERCDATPTITDRLNAILMEYCVQKDHGLI